MTFKIRTFRLNEEQRERLDTAIENLMKTIVLVVKENMPEKYCNPMAVTTIIAELTLEVVAKISLDTIKVLSSAVEEAIKEMQK